MIRVLTLCFFVALAAAKHEKYEGFSVYEVTPKNVQEMTYMRSLEGTLNLDFWTHAVINRPCQILTPKDSKEALENKLQSAGIQFKETVENLRELLELEEKLLGSSTTRRATNNTRSLPFDTVYTWEEIDNYIDEVAQRNPRIVSVATGGYTWENRPVKYLKISSTNFQDLSKPIVYIQTLLHAREWITQSVSLYAIERLVNDLKEDEADLLRNIDWIIVPVANPDGFVDSHVRDRFWRKNTALGYYQNDICHGVDLNRNFDVLWSLASSSFVCMDDFHGSKAFSEPEAVVVKDIIEEHLNRIELFLDVHSYGSYILYGYGNGQLPPNSLIVHWLAVEMANTIDELKASFNPRYTVGNVALTLYAASGSTADYATLLGVPFAYTIEMPAYRGNGWGYDGFLVDPDFIEQAAFETWEGIKVGARYAVQSYRERYDGK